ncbi:MAG: hydantoinase/oxoprolinase family protein [Methanomicrobiales archaeon]|nr:hydantoinase/oxoprolinase family protein [Methanomicrobiales archaeon]MDI6877430.1 hydantoinase/oxoprolinase family protein [Methanomicrobiales archaeon]
MIGIDVGGANLKVVDGRKVDIRYCPLFAGAPLADMLQNYARAEGVDAAAVVMSGELADCFGSRMEGVSFIVRAVRAAIPGAIFYGTDARFHREAVPQLAAANWLASADYLRERYPHGILVDMGSTTTDIVPLSRFPELLGLTDLERLQQGYLLYSGMLRTSVAAILPEVKIDGVPTPTSSEFFAASADAHLVLGHLREEEYACPPPDGRDATLSGAMRRLARVVCADLDEIGQEGAVQIARACWETQRRQILERVEQVRRGCRADTIVAAGIGSPLLARELGGIDLREEIGSLSDALPAYAVQEVAGRTGSW